MYTKIYDEIDFSNSANKYSNALKNLTKEQIEIIKSIKGFDYEEYDRLEKEIEKKFKNLNKEEDDKSRTN